jgi:hypothetical protein
LRTFLNYGQKGFITLGPGGEVLKLFSLSLTAGRNDFKYNDTHHNDTQHVGQIEML